MPFQDGKKQLIIIDNLSLVVEKLLSCVSDESELGRAEFIRMIKAAQERYYDKTGERAEMPKQSIFAWGESAVGKFIQFIHSFTRTRGAQIDLATQSIEGFPDAYTRLQEFKNLVSTGEWHENSSFNYFFFDELIHSIPGYEPLTDKDRHTVILRTKELVLAEVDSFIEHYKANRKIVTTKEQELQAQQSTQKIVGIVNKVSNVFIAYDLETAKQSVTSSPAASSSSSSSLSSFDRIQFCLTMKNERWKLYWVDALGKVYHLEPREELAKLLIGKKPENLDGLKPIINKRLKEECFDVLNLFLDRVQVLINPKDSKTQKDLNVKALAQLGHLNTFVLRGKDGHYNLCWINAHGKGSNIITTQYPELGSWLKEQESVTKEHVYQLKTYLLHIDTAKAIGREDFKLELKNCLEKRSLAPKAPASEFQPKRLDMSLYANIAQIYDKLSTPPAQVTAASSSQAVWGDEVNDNEEVLVQSDSEIKAEQPKVKQPKAGKLNLEKFSLVAQSVGAKSKVVVEEPATAELEEHSGLTLS